LDTVFFALSKLVGFALKLEVWLLVLAILTFWASMRSRRRLAIGSSATLVGAIVVMGVLPVGDALVGPLENEFAIQKVISNVDGIVVLGGGEDVAASRRSGQPQLNDGADRYIAALALAQRFPQARLLFAGGVAGCGTSTGQGSLRRRLPGRFSRRRGLPRSGWFLKKTLGTPPRMPA
jgi:uncharacterized SAM-binding protein YcdF (DUF218 family)